MKNILQDLLQGKFAITYTLETIAKMVPRQIRWLNNLPILGNIFQAGQFIWFITKIIFFTTVISWFKPQYYHAGAKVALFILSFALIFAARWMMKRELSRRASVN